MALPNTPIGKAINIAWKVLSYHIEEHDPLGRSPENLAVQTEVKLRPNLVMLQVDLQGREGGSYIVQVTGLGLPGSVVKTIASVHHRRPNGPELIQSYPVDLEMETFEDPNIY